ncbi:FAD-dependent monooxygenase [Micromonospora sp. M12]
MRVLIIGAGLGGLTLLHGLRSAGIDARVFERSAHRAQQPASYGIHLNADGLRALHACLPDQNWKMIDEAGTPVPLIIRFHDPAAASWPPSTKAPRTHHRPDHQTPRDQPRQAPRSPPAQHRRRRGTSGALGQEVHPLRAAQRRRPGVLRRRLSH